MSRKIWVKRPGASATLVRVADDDVVDEVRDLIIRKYANSLGRTFDAPDVVLRIISREKTHSSADRTLSPDEPVWPLLEAYYPGGQAIEEALVIDIPAKKTPRIPSPKAVPRDAVVSFYEDMRPVENGTDYFPPMATVLEQAPPNMPIHELRQAYYPLTHPHSISVLETGHVPALPSPLPREARERRHHQRPRIGRQHTSSPTMINGALTSGSHHPPRQPRPHLADVDTKHHIEVPPPPPLPTPPASDNNSHRPRAASPLDRASSPRPSKIKTAKKSPSTKNNKQSLSRPTEGLDNSVPPINVLIVEDNIINLKLLEQMVKRLKVRWQTAMNGRDAVTKWRAGGFHLVLMDIQMPIMNGLDATKEIRRLERINGIGVFAKTEEEQRGNDLAALGIAGGGRRSAVTMAAAQQVNGDDKLAAGGVFRSPVIIVALTASSLQSDRHEALAAGCNDFLTKPVDNEWFERKIMEWGCMQALIDFDGWRKWKEDSQRAEKATRLDPEVKAKQEKKDAKRAALLAKMGNG